MKLFVLCAAALFLCSFGHHEKSSKEQIQQFQNEIDRIIDSVDPNLHIGVEVISVKTGQRLYEKNAHHLFVPASSLKIFTAAAALGILGVDYQFETQVLSDGEVRNGVLEGNLYLKGSGDPTLTSHDLEELVYQLKANQIVQITGDLVIDISDFDTFAQGPGWMWDEGAEYWNSPMDALTVNHSCVRVWIKPADDLSKPARVYCIPATDYVTIQNATTTDEAQESLQVERKWLTKENLIQIKGTACAGSCPVSYEVPVESPHQYTAHLFRDLLRSQGIELKGSIDTRPAPIDAEELVSHSSQPLSAIVQSMMKTSDNMYSNCLFKKIGQIRYGAPGTWPKGGQAVRDFLQSQAGLDVSGLVILDGDGESRYNLVTPHQMTQFLLWAYRQFKFSPEFISSLPIGGVDGSLKQRMSGSGLKHKVRAKPGTMTGITSVAGYVTTKDGEELAFTIMMNGFVKPCAVYKKQIEDKICFFLANSKR